MPLNTHILTSSKEIKPFAKEIETVIKSVESSINKILSLGDEDIDIVFYNNPEATMKESGIGGYTPCANVIFFSLDPKNLPAWSRSLTDNQIKALLIKSSKEWDLPNYNHNDWFYGSDAKQIPRWTGYALGYYLVATYLQKNPNVKASEIISVSAEVFRV